MSKSRGNVANPDSLKEKYGADAIRMHIIFLGPLEKDKVWSSQGIEGSRRFLERIWRLCFDDKGNVLPEENQMTETLHSLFNHTIKKVTEDIETLNLNTAISSMMILVNELYRKKVRNHKVLRILSQLLMPFAPHIAEEIWSALGGKGFASLQPWPEWTKSKIDLKECVIGVQVNGKNQRFYYLFQKIHRNQKLLSKQKRMFRFKMLFKTGKLERSFINPVESLISSLVDKRGTLPS